MHPAGVLRGAGQSSPLLVGVEIGASLLVDYLAISIKITRAFLYSLTQPSNFSKFISLSVCVMFDMCFL